MKIKRANNKRLNELLGVEIPVLDKGFIRVIDYMGDDAAIVQAARVSYGEGTKQKTKDRGLIRYLMKHRHTSPFEMCELKIHVKMPIFVARQWIRHRTANVNEYSGRYSVIKDEFYIPQKENLAVQSTINKQGRGAVLDEVCANNALSIIEGLSSEAYDKYQSLLNINEGEGLARELARMVLPVNAYTEWYWKIDLHNLLHFISLRADSHAQFEIREYADKLIEVLKIWVPLTWAAFEDYRMYGKSFSKDELVAIRHLIKGEPVALEDLKLSKREIDDLYQILNVK